MFFYLYNNIYRKLSLGLIEVLGVIMNVQRIFMWMAIINSCINQAAPMVQKIINKSQIDFIVVLHSDASSCSLRKKNIKIEANSSFVGDFLLEPSVKLKKSISFQSSSRKTKHSSNLKNIDKASLILRPAYYYDDMTKTRIPLLNKDKMFDNEMVKKAYAAWKSSGKKRKFNDAQHWLDRWIGKDIVVVPDVLEASGYIMHLSRIRISNQARDHAQWLSYAKGIFSRLVVDIQIDQHDRKGVIPSLKVTPGEGGICIGGAVERI